MAQNNPTEIVIQDLFIREQVLKGNLDYFSQTLDATCLKVDAHQVDILTLAELADKNQARAICIAPSFVQTAEKKICETKSSVRLCSVVGFPSGYTTLENKMVEILELKSLGCVELDFVQNVGLAKEGRWDEVFTQFEKLSKTADGILLKVILETALLSTEEIFKVTQLACEAGIHYVKTSTGFSSRGASISDIETMASAITDFQKKNAKCCVGIKASGGIKSQSQALNLIKAGASRIGASQLNALLS